jgi:hypothetical protein
VGVVREGAAKCSSSCWACAAVLAIAAGLGSRERVTPNLGETFAFQSAAVKALFFFWLRETPVKHLWAASCLLTLRKSHTKNKMRPNLLTVNAPLLDQFFDSLRRT